jgi:hypothetical protein
MFAEKAMSLPMSGVLERCCFVIGSGLISKHYSGLEKLSRDKNSRLFLNNGRKKFYKIGPRELGVQVFQVSPISISAI